jgi:hypothetical protein
MKTEKAHPLRHDTDSKFIVCFRFSELLFLYRITYSINHMLFFVSCLLTFVALLK